MCNFKRSRKCMSLPLWPDQGELRTVGKVDICPLRVRHGIDWEAVVRM